MKREGQTMQSNDLWLTGIALAAGIVAGGIDLKYRKIPNWLTFGTLGLGLALHIWWGGCGEVLTALGGSLTGLILAAAFFLSGGLGGGDVKLLMALGALLGPARVLWVFICAGLAGGLFSLIYLIHQLGLTGAYLRLRLLTGAFWDREKRKMSVQISKAQPLKLPYGIAICSGLVGEVILKLR
jgi:prepilin peptidase CpaA